MQNEVPVRSYSARIAAGRLATARGYRLTQEDRLRAAIIERLMCDFEADLSAICSRHGFEPAALVEENARLAQALDDGLAEMDGGVLRVPTRHRFLIRAVAATFDAYLDRSPRIHGKAA